MQWMRLVDAKKFWCKLWVHLSSIMQHVMSHFIYLSHRYWTLLSVIQTAFFGTFHHHLWCWHEPKQLWLKGSLLIKSWSRSDHWTEAEALVVHACRQAILIFFFFKAVFKRQVRREKTVGSSRRTVFTVPWRLPLNRGELQYLTLRDLSSHDQDREEGKVGREEAAVPKGPLPI